MNSEKAINVLLVEDNKDFARLVKMFLAKAEGTRFDIVWKENGLEAVEEVKNNKSIDVILMDYFMPGVNGLEAVRRIHQMGIRTPVVFLTVNRDGGLIIEAKKLGVQDVLIKEEISTPVLPRTIQRLLERREPPGEVEQQEEEFLALSLFGDKIRLISLAPDGTYRFVDDSRNIHNILYVVSLETKALRLAVEELEELINDQNAGEDQFQEFFQRNPHFLLNDEYKDAHPHVLLVKDDGKPLIPDFMLEPLDQNKLCDLLDLKLPSTEIFVLKRNRMRFSAAVFEACAQLREYNLYFEDSKNRDLVYKNYGLLAYKPRMFVIIGRRGNVNPLDVRRMETDIPSLCLSTYDDMITRMRGRIRSMERGGRM